MYSVSFDSYLKRLGGLGEQKKRGDVLHPIKIELSEKIKQIELHTFADLHIGDKFCDMKLINKRLEYIKNKNNAYCILNGDLLNNATKTSVSDSYAESIPPMEQLEKGMELFEPIKEKILAITSGNHENRTYNKEGIDISEILSMQLNIRNRYCKEGALVFLRFGRNNKQRKMLYTIYASHGSGGGKKEGGKINRLSDMAGIVDADIYIHSHTHLPAIIKQAFYRVDYQNSTVSLADKLFVNTGQH